jgi:hypothetical protein
MLPAPARKKVARHAFEPPGDSAGHAANAGHGGPTNRLKPVRSHAVHWLDVALGLPVNKTRLLADADLEQLRYLRCPCADSGQDLECPITVLPTRVADRSRCGLIVAVQPTPLGADSAGALQCGSCAA